MHVVLQQTPSGAQEIPATHPPAVAVQACPRLLLQAPAASQVPAHESVSAALMTGVQTPVDAAQAWQLPQVAVVQQTPSTQWPLAQVRSWPAVQIAPFALRFTHTLVVGSQYWLAAHGWVAPHPPEHCIPSAAHWFEVQGVPVTVVQAPMPSQVEAIFATPAAQLGPAHCFSDFGY